MKLFILALVLATSYMMVSAQRGDWLSLDVDQLNIDPNLRDIMNFGVQYVITKGLNDGPLNSGSNYYLDNVDSIETQLARGTKYRFTVQLLSEWNEQATVRFAVFDQPWSKTRKVTSYTFTDVQGRPTGAEEEEVLDGSWFTIDQYNQDADQDWMRAFNITISDVLAEGVQNGQLLEGGRYKLFWFHSVKGQVVDGMNYRYNVELEGDQGWGVTVIFSVYESAEDDNKIEVTDYLFTDITPKNDAEEEEEGEFIAGGWSSVDVGSLETDENLKDILDFGVKSVVTQAVQSGRLTDSGYQLDKVHSIETQVVQGYNYWFDVDLKNYKGDLERVTFEVYDYPDENTREVTSSSLDESEYPYAPSHI